METRTEVEKLSSKFGKAKVVEISKARFAAAADSGKVAKCVVVPEGFEMRDLERGNRFNHYIKFSFEGQNYIIAIHDDWNTGYTTRVRKDR